MKKICWGLAVCLFLGLAVLVLPSCRGMEPKKADMVQELMNTDRRDRELYYGR